MGRIAYHIVALLWMVGALGCATQTPAVGQTATPNGERKAVDIGIRTVDEEWIELATLRGQPLLLFVFATFDGTSQALLRPLRGIATRRPELPMLGIAAQPDARMLLPAWAYALDPPFVAGFDPTESLQKGLTALGELESVPLMVLLDDQGFEIGRLRGFQQESQIDAWLNTLLRSRP